MKKITTNVVHKPRDREGANEDFIEIVQSYVVDAAFKGCEKATAVVDGQTGQTHVRGSEIANAMVNATALFWAQHASNKPGDDGDAWREKQGNIMAKLFCRALKTLAEIEAEEPGAVNKILYANDTSEEMHVTIVQHHDN